MNGIDVLVDTNILLYLLGGNKQALELLTGKRLFISIINEMELLSYPGLTLKEEVAIKEFMNVCLVVDMNQVVKQKAIAIRKSFKLKLPDSIVFATAEYLRIPFLTADKGFKKVDSNQILFFEFEKG